MKCEQSRKWKAVELMRGFVDKRLMSYSIILFNTYTHTVVRRKLLMEIIKKLLDF